VNDTRRKQLLVSALLAIGALVLADQFGLIPGRSTSAEAVAVAGAVGARPIYLARARRAAMEQALIERAPRWRAAAEQARERWEQARRAMVVERTVELAEARFRDLALDALKDLNLAAVRASAVSQASGATPKSGSGASAGVKDEGEGARVLTITLEVKFDATGQREVYAALDRLENLAGLRTNIASLRVDGPGRIQISQTISATLTLQAQAAVGEVGVVGEVG